MSLRPLNFLALVLVAGAATAVKADEMASYIKLSVDQPTFEKKIGWRLVKKGAAKGGKFKIFTEPPVFDDDDKLIVTPANELREKDSTQDLDPSKDYWIVFYPKNGNMEQELEFQRIQGDKVLTTATFKMSGIVVGSFWMKGPARSFSAKDSKVASWTSDNYGKGVAITSSGSFVPGKTFIELK